MWRLTIGTLRDRYWRPRVFLVWVLPLAILAGPWFFWGLQLLAYCAAVLFLAWLRKLYEDWGQMYWVGMHMADKHTEAAMCNPEIRYATVKMDRVFPRCYWVLVVADEDSVRMHQGWCFFRSSPPPPEKILKSRIYRQVA